MKEFTPRPKLKIVNAINKANGKLRAVLARSRASRFGVDDREKAFFFRTGMQATLMLARLQAKSELADAYFREIKKVAAVESNRSARQPIGYDYLSQLKLPPPISLEKELLWVGKRIKHFTHQINDILKSRAAIEERFLSGDHEAAINLLDDAERTYGSSLWSVALQIALRQAYLGTEAQKQYVAEIRKAHKSGALPYFANSVSQRSEPTVTAGWYRESIRRRLTSRERSDTTVYLESKLAVEIPSSEKEIATLLRVEQNHHEFDIYETFVAIVLKLITENKISEISAALARVLEDLVEIEDWRLSKARRALGIVDLNTLPTSNMSSIDQLLKGDAASAYRAAKLALKSNPGSFYDVIALAACVTGRRRLVNEKTTWKNPGLFAAKAMRLVLTKEDLVGARRSSLRQFALAFSGLSFGAALLEFTNINNTADIKELERSLFAVSLKNKEIGIFDSATISSVCTLDATPIKYFQCLIGNTGSGVYDLPADISAYARAFADSWILVKKGDYSGAKPHVHKLRESSSRWLAAHGAALLLAIYAQLGELGGAFDVITDEICEHGTSKVALPIIDVFKYTTWEELKPHATKMSTSIALSVWSDLSDDDKLPTYRRFLLQDFLSSLGVGRPSELRDRAAEFSHNALVLFLRQACSPHILDMLRSIKTSSAVLAERRAIFALLSTLDESNAASYEHEVVAISRELTVRDGMRVIDGSRVHIDYDALKNKLRRDLAQTFSRYAALIQSGVGVAENIETVVRDMAKKEDLSKYLLSIPENEADDILISMLSQIKDRFLLDIPHGLDSYLSKRIRHGSIVGHIRGPALVEGIVFQQNTDGSYVTNNSLIQRVDESDRRQFASVMENFSGAFDAYLFRLRDVILHVKSADHPLGIFQAQYNSVAFHVIRSSLQVDFTLEGFLENTLSVLWRLLQNSLQEAKALLEGDVKRFATEQIQLLRDRALSSIGSAPERLKVDAAIGRALVGVQAKIDSAAAWFEPNSLDQRDYSVEEAIHIGLAAVKAMRPDFDPLVTMDINSDRPVAAANLPTFVDALYITLGNVAVHAGGEARNKVSIAVVGEPGSHVFRVTIESDAHAKPDIYQCNEKLGELKRKILSDTYDMRIREEGGSGFHKLASMLGQSAGSSLDFGYRNKNRFFVQMDLKFPTV